MNATGRSLHWAALALALFVALDLGQILAAAAARGQQPLPTPPANASGRTQAEPERQDPAGDESSAARTDRMLREIASLEQQCLDEVNQMRAAHRLPPLQFYESLLDVARGYSRRMAEEDFFGHTDPQGRSVRQRVNAAHIPWHLVGENLAYSNGYTNPVAPIMTGWMASPGHRRNILDPKFKQTAIGAWINPKGRVFFTQVFLTRDE